MTTPNHQRGTHRVIKPSPGDVIVCDVDNVHHSCQKGDLLEVTNLSYVPHGRDHLARDVITAIARKNIHSGRAFYGPQNAVAGGTERHDCSGGPFFCFTVQDYCFELRGATENTFWRWLDYPRAGGDEIYNREVACWHLSEKATSERSE